MGFLTPWFLAGVVAVGLPIWLHLLKRHKTEPKPFPSLMFFEHREQSSVQHRRLDYILLFILRTLMVLLLALLFANPFIRRPTPKGLGQKLVVVAVDRSFSMRTKEGGSTRLDLAKSEAMDVLSRIAPGTKAQVVALSNNLQAMTQQTNDPGELRAAVQAIQEGDSRAVFGELARYLRTLSETTKMPLEVHLISDLQKSAMPPGFTDLRLDDDTALIYDQIGKVQPNWAVENVNVLPSSHVYDPKRVRIQATIAGFAAPTATRSVTLMLNGKAVQSKSVTIPENGRGAVEFVGLDASYGFNKCEVRIDSADGLAEDDHFAFAVERTDPKKVLFVDDGRHGRAETYFRTALDAKADAAFKVDVLQPDAAATANLAGVVLVVLSDVGTLPPSLESALDHYVAGGGSVLESLGPASVAMPRAPVLDEAIEKSVYAGRDALYFTASDVDSTHKALEHVERFDGVKFYQAIRVTPAKSQVLAKLSDGTPLVLERKIGEGHVLTFTSTFDDTSNDLQRHNSWVPFVQDSVRYLGGGGVEQQVNLPVDSYVDLRTGNQKGAAAEVLDPDGHRVLSLDEATNARNFGLSREGFFDVKTAAGRRLLVAAHADRKESDLTVMDPDQLKLWQAMGTGGATGSGGGDSGSDANTRPWSLSPYILLLLLGVAMAESVIANGYLRPGGQHPETAAEPVKQE